jgi:hypothetical protein
MVKGGVMGTEIIQLRRRKFGETMRRDAWWVQPLIVFVVLSSFLVYATWAAFQNAHYEYGNYLSPFYSPLLLGDSPNAWFGPKPGWWPGLLPFSPALLILPFPAGFRFTCYYYRGAYYKVLLGGYTFGCHSFRHIVGGHLDRLARRPVRKTAYDCVSCFNRAHMRWAWFSLFGVALSDVYVRLCSMGIIHDLRLF